MQIRSMEATAIKPDTCTYTALVEGFCHEGQLDKAEALLFRMAESKPGQRPSRVTYNILLKACGAMVSPELEHMVAVDDISTASGLMYFMFMLIPSVAMWNG